MEPDLILEQARAALERDPSAGAEVNRIISRLTDNRYKNLSALEQFARADAVAGEGSDRRADLLARVANVPGSAARDATADPTPGGSRRVSAGRAALEGGLQGATLGFSDEIAGGVAAAGPGGRGFTEARDARRAALDEVREAQPLSTGAGELVGSLFAPLGVASKVVKGAGTLAKAGRGAVAGATGGASYGAGTGDGTEDRLLRAGLGGLGGAAGGAALGTAAGVAGNVAGKVQRAKLGRDIPEIPDVQAVADKLADEINIPGGRIQKRVDLAKEGVKQVREAAYKPLDSLGRITDSEVLSTLRGTRVGGEAGAAIKWAAKRVLRDRPLEDGATFKELQSVSARLRGRETRAGRAGDNAEADLFRQARGEVESILERRIPGVPEANAQYRSAISARKAFDEGVKAYGEGPKITRPEQFEQRLAALPDDVSRANARAGAAAVEYDKLSKTGGKVTQQWLDRMRSVGMQSRIRLLFDSPASYQRFLKQIDEAGEAILTGEQMTKARAELAKLAPWTVGAVVGGGVVGAVGSLFD